MSIIRLKMFDSLSGITPLKQPYFPFDLWQ